MDEEYTDPFERLAEREKHRSKGQIENDNEKEPIEQNGKETLGKTTARLDQPADDQRRPERAFAKLVFEFTLKHFLEENDSPEKLTLYNVNLMDPCYQNIDQCKLGKCISDAVDKWHCHCDGKPKFLSEKLSIQS